MAIPKYQHIKDELKQQIISGKFENGDKFYTEAELIKIYDVSSITVVRALNDLAADGYIVRQQGKGTFVSRARKHKLVEFSDVETFPIQKAKVKVLSIKRGNTLSILDKLGLNPTQFEEVNEIVFPTPSKVAKVLKIDENFPTVKQVKTTKLEATGQILEYTETYKRGDYYKIKFISCDRDH